VIFFKVLQAKIQFTQHYAISAQLNQFYGGLSRIGNNHQYVQTASFPCNKLAEKQKQFFSTRKKSQVQQPKVTLSETTTQELEAVEPYVCAFCLKEELPNYTEATDSADWVECGQRQV